MRLLLGPLLLLLDAEGHAASSAAVSGNLRHLGQHGSVAMERDVRADEEEEAAEEPEPTDQGLRERYTGQAHRESKRTVSELKNAPAKLRKEFWGDLRKLSGMLLPGMKFYKDIALLNCICLLAVGLWFYYYTKFIYVTDRPHTAATNLATMLKKTAEATGRTRTQTIDSSIAGALNTPRSARGLAVQHVAEPAATSAPSAASGEARSGIEPGRWEPQAESEMADIVLVFHHPNCDAYKDAETPFGIQNLGHVLTHHGDTASKFDKLERIQTDWEKSMEQNPRSWVGVLKSNASTVLGRAVAQGVEDKVKSVEGTVKSLTPSILSPVREEGRSSAEEKELMTMRTARAHLFQDLYECLPKLGFHVTCYSSIDEDELFLGISLKSKIVMDHYLRKVNAEIQIRSSVVRKLGIDTDLHEAASAPPFLRYDATIVQKLFEAGVLPSNDERELFRKHYDRDPEHGCILSGKEIIRIIYREVSSHIDLDAAKEEGLIVDWYPGHSEAWLNEFKKSWAKFAQVKDFTFHQPMQLIHDYFGARIAFNFGWNGFFCKMLLALLPMTFIFELTLLTRHWHGMGAHMNANNRPVAFPLIVIIAWTRIAWNLWCREEEWFERVWSMGAQRETKGMLMRPQFFGELLPSNYDKNIRELQYPEWKYTARKCLATLAVLIFCFLVCCCILAWVSLFADRMNLVAAVCLSIQIKIFEVVFNHLVDDVTDFENHKWAAHHYNSYLWKMFLFQAVNNYSAFLFLAVKQAHTHGGCGEEGCLHVVNAQLSMTIFLLALCRLFQVIVRTWSVRWRLWREMDALHSRSLLSSLRKFPGRVLRAEEVTGDGEQTRTFEEDQSKYEEFRIKEQIETMCQLVLSLGFVLLFGAIAPLIVIFCFVVFVTQLRCSWYLMTNCSRRPIPRVHHGVGAWSQTIWILMHIGVLFSGYLFVEFGVTFQGVPVLTKLTGIIIFCVCTVVGWGIVDFFWPPHEPDIVLLQSRRDHVLRRLASRAEDGTRFSQLQVEQHEKLADEIPQDLYSDAVRDGMWAKIERRCSKTPRSGGDNTLLRKETAELGLAE